MANNIEKFNAQKSMQKRTLEEGIVDYEEQKLEAAATEDTRKRAQALEMSKKADEIIDSFYAEGLERGITNPDFDLSEKLAQYPAGIKNAIFGRWLEREPGEALWRMDEFESLPSYFQKEVAEYLAHNESLVGWIPHYILQVFDKITDRDLHRFVVDSDRTKFSTLAENKDKLPYISDEQILKRAEHGSEKAGGHLTTTWYDWKAVIPHIDKFPSVDKQQAIKGTLRQSTNPRPGVLIEHREKLDLSERELIDAFYQHKKAYELCRNLEHIDPKHHQEIADKTVEEGQHWSVLQNAKHFQQINIGELLTKIAESKPQANLLYKDGVAVIVNEFHHLPKDWSSQMPQDLVDEIVKRDASKVAYRVDEFGEKVDRQKLSKKLFAQMRFDALISTAEKLGHTRDEVFANRIIDAGGASNVISRLNDFPKMSRQMYLRLVQEKPKAAIPKILRFDGITKDDVYKAVTTAGVEGREYIDSLLHNPAQIAGLQLNEEFAEKLAQGPGYDLLLNNLEKFEDIDYAALASNLIEAGRMYNVVGHVAKFKGIDHQWLADEAIEKGMGETLIANYHNFQGLDDHIIVQKLLQRKGNIPYRIAERIDAFPGLAQDRALREELWRNCLRYNWDISVMVKLHEFSTPPIDQTFSLAYDLLGDQLTPGALATIGAVKDGSVSSEDMKKLGITKTGETGINQLRQRLNRFKSEILGRDFDTAVLEGSPFYRQYYKAYVRYDDSEWGEHDEQSFEQIVATHNRLKHESRLRELPKEYAESGEVRIAKVDREKQEAFQYSEQFLSRFGTLRESIAKALELFDQKRPLSHLVEGAETKRVEILQTLKNKLAQLQHPKAVENLQKRIEMLEGLDLRSVKNFQGNFEILSQFSEFHEELRQLVFYYALQKNRDYRGPAKEVTHREKPQFDDVRWVINFIEHIVNEETWAKYFTDDRATKSFRKIVNVNALNEEFARAQNQAASGSASVEFIPTRGLLMEFSGHIADACWASKHDSMAELFPNFSAVVLVQNRGTKHERLAGAGMLIETTAHDGTPLLVIRGLNPIENVINSLDVEDFYQKFTGYIKQIAERTGRQPAIVIDDHSGGSASNRPALFHLLREKKEALQRVILASGEDTSFNGYNIVSCTYKVE
jgi:hypothetical protein